MAGHDPLTVKIRPEAPGSAAAQTVLATYFREIVGRHHGRAATGAEAAAAMHAEPSDDLCPPGWARPDGCSCCRRPAAVASDSGC
jgi:hypothetical protein